MSDTPPIDPIDPANPTVFDDLLAGLAEADARMFSQKSNELAKTRELQRFWPDLMFTDASDFEPYRMFLEQFTSAKNYPTRQRWVDDPMVDGVPFTGRWRAGGVNIKSQGGVPYIVQVLRFGWLESIVDYYDPTKLDPTEATLLNPGMYDPTRKLVVFAFLNVSTEKMTMVADSAPTTIVDPIIWGANLPTGTWYRKAKSARQGEDGSGIVLVAYSTEPDEVLSVMVENSAASWSVKAIKRFDEREDAIAYINTDLVTTTVAGEPEITTGVVVNGSFEKTDEGYLAEVIYTYGKNQISTEQSNSVGSTHVGQTNSDIMPANVDSTSAGQGYDAKDDSGNVVPVAGQVTTFMATPRKDGMVETKATKTTTNNQTGSDVNRRVGMLDEGKTNSALTITPSENTHGYGDTAEVGKSKTFIVQPNPDGSMQIKATQETENTLDSNDIVFTDINNGLSMIRSVSGITPADAQTLINTMMGASETPPTPPTNWLGYRLTPRVSIGPNGLMNLHLHVTPVSGGAPPKANWANFKTIPTLVRHDYTVGSKAYYVQVVMAVMQSNDQDAVQAFLHNQGNPHFDSINGGKHFRGTYMTITSRPVEITADPVDE